MWSWRGVQYGSHRSRPEGWNALRYRRYAGDVFILNVRHRGSSGKEDSDIDIYLFVGSMATDIDTPQKGGFDLVRDFESSDHRRKNTTRSNQGNITSSTVNFSEHFHGVVIWGASIRSSPCYEQIPSIIVLDSIGRTCSWEC